LAASSRLPSAIDTFHPAQPNRPLLKREQSMCHMRLINNASIR
jgi:hypothetical protein